MARTLSVPGDIDNYQINRLVFRDFRSGGARIVEAQWGAVDADPPITDAHPAEVVSFLETAPGVWNRATSLRGGALSGG